MVSVGGTFVVYPRLQVNFLPELNYFLIEEPCF